MNAGLTGAVFRGLRSRKVTTVADLEKYPSKPHSPIRNVELGGKQVDLKDEK